MLCMHDDSQLMDKAFRVKIIQQITSAENQDRKKKAKKEHEIYRDMTVKWVMLGLKKEGLKSETLAIMENRAANISILRRVIKKLSRAYDGEVTRTAGSPAVDAQISVLAELLDMDQKQMKADRYSTLHKNSLVVTLPEKVMSVGEKDLYKLKKVVMAPYQFDVIANSKDKTQAAALIFSGYDENSVLDIPTNNPTVSNLQLSKSQYVSTPDNVQWKTPRNLSMGGAKNEFIIWSENYHFTMDDKGDILAHHSPEGLQNPIKMIPGVGYNENQDESYWGEGGSDLVDGSILVNTLLTDMFSIAYIQGFGQIVITGKNIKEKMEWGPHVALTLSYDPSKEEPKPEVTVVSANPPIGDWMAAVEQYVALLLSTNELSPANVAIKLDPAQFPSGIAMLIEKSEAKNDIRQKRKQFRGGEMKDWEITKRWQNLYFGTGQLIPEFMVVGPIPEETIVKTHFLDSAEVITEKEKLENLKLRKDLGLNTDAELIRMDNPSLSVEEAEERAKMLKEAKGKVESAISEANKIVDNLVDEKNKETEVEEEEESNGDQ